MPTPAHRVAVVLAPRLALLAGLLLPGNARALDVSLSLADGDALVSRAECTARSSEEVEVTWDLASASGSTVEILASDASGCSSDATSAVLVDDLSTSRTSYPESGETAFTVADVLEAAGKSVGTCDGDDFRTYVCVRLLDSSGSTVATGTATLRFQLERPPPPVSLAVSAGENALHVRWAAGTATTGAAADSDTYKVFAAAGGTTVSSGGTTDTSLRLGGLANGTTYDVWVVAYSEAGNASDASAQGAGTPAPVEDFYEVYRSDGGSEQRGCQSGDAGILGALVALALALRPRRRPRGAARAATLGALLLLAPAAARAERGGRGALELGAATYLPSIDRDFHGTAKPYADVFGGGARPIFQLTGAWAAWAGTSGRLELGLRGGFFRATGHGQFTDGTESEDTTALTLVPVGLVVTGRLGLGRWGVPLEPYARLGLERYSWWVTDGAGKTTRRGATHGWSSALGLALSLGALDRENARDVREEAGLQDLAVFVEATWARIDDFGRRGSWDLSPRGVSLGGGLRIAF
jgi:MYXO-CTERM domain-containing protein